MTFTDYQRSIPDLEWNGLGYSGTCPCCNDELTVKVYGPNDFEASCLSRCSPKKIAGAVSRGATALPAREEAPHPAVAYNPPPPPRNGHKPPAVEPTVTKFPLISFEELCALPPPKWQVEDFFMEETVVQLFGETSHGKSLIAWDLACSICIEATEWFGRQILRHGPVVWINADGGRGLTLRAKAWAEANNTEMKHPLLTLMGSVQINKPEQIGAFRAQLAAMEEKPVLVVFDTQSRCMPGGDENDQGVMTAVTEGLHRLKTEVGCTVLLIHHTDKTGQWERGSGVVKNETDTQIRVTKDDDSGIFTVSCRKQRDGGDRFADFFYTLQPVGESVVITQSEIGPEKHKPENKKQGKREQFLQIILNEPGITRKAISERMNISMFTACGYTDELIDLKVIIEEPLPRRPGQSGPTQKGLYPHPGEASE